MAAQDKSEGGISGKAIYIDTQGKFRPERIAAIAKSRGFDIRHTLSNVSCAKTMSTHQQELAIENIQSRLDKDSSIKLLIVDSVISNYRPGFSKEDKPSERRKKLYKFMGSLSALAQRYNIEVVITNQINFSDHSGAATPTGGSIVGQASTYRISLKRLPNNFHKIAIKIVSSLYHRENGTYLMINEKGIDDIL